MNWLSKRTPAGIQYILSMGITQQSMEGNVSQERAACENVLNCYKSEERCTAPWDRGLLNPPDDVTGEMILQILDPNGQFVREVPYDTGNLLSALWDTAGRPKKVLLRGAAGFGKTHLCERIVRQWADSGGKEPTSPRGTTFLVYLKFRSLGAEADLEEELWKLVRENYSQCFGDTLKKPDFVLLLDGHNEAKEKHKRQVKDLILGANDNSLFKSSPVIVSSRPEVEREFLTMFDRHFFLRGLSDAAADVLVRKYYENSNCAVNFILPKFRDLLMRYKMSPMLLVMLCYLQRHHFAERLETIEQVIYQCAFQFLKMGLEQGGVKNRSIERGLHDLGKRFLNFLHDRQFQFARSELADFPQDILSSGLFRSVGAKGDNLEVIHTSFMEALATHHVNEFWYSLPSDRPLVNFVSSFAAYMTSYELFVYRDTSKDVSFKVIGECRDVGFFVWDFRDGSCIFSTSLDKTAVPRRMGDCTLNITFTLKFRTQKSVTNFLTVFKSILPDCSLSLHIPYFVPQTEACSFQLNFVINELDHLCTATSDLYARKSKMHTDTCPWRKLRESSSEVSLTFLGKGCNHRSVEDLMRNLMNIDVSLEKETSNATDLLEILKKYDTADSSFICTLAGVAKMGHYYVVDTRRWYALEDLRPWSKKAFFHAKYSWNSVDLLVLAYQRKDVATSELCRLFAG